MRLNTQVITKFFLHPNLPFTNQNVREGVCVSASSIAVSRTCKVVPVPKPRPNDDSDDDDDALIQRDTLHKRKVSTASVSSNVPAAGALHMRIMSKA